MQGCNAALFIMAATLEEGWIWDPELLQDIIALPNNISYIHLSAGVVFVQGIGYWFVYPNMLRICLLMTAS